MATHDYVIDNASGSAVRTDLNNVFQAILTNNSSGSSPSTTAAYMFWADTSNNILKIRNSANNAWVELFQLDGTLTLEDGSNSTPALAFRDDLNTGIFSSAADTVDVSCGGTTRGSFSSSGLTVTGNVTATTFVGDVDANNGDFDGTLEADAITVGGTALNTVIAGVASTNVTVADESSDTTCFPLFVTAATGDLPPKTGSNLSFNSSNGTLTATAFAGDGSGLTGLSSGGVTSDGQQNTKAGSGAGDSFTGTDAEENTLFGYNAGNEVTSGDNNTFFGREAGGNITSTHNNTAIGHNALNTGTTIGGCTAIGASALAVCAVSHETAVGYNSLKALTNGSKNVALGYNTGQALQTGHNNTFIGYEAGRLNTSSDNVYIGRDCGYNAVGSGYGTFVGSQAGRNVTTGTENTMIGNTAGNNLTTGGYNFFGGRLAGERTTTGNNNIHIGYQAGRFFTTAGTNVFIGQETGKGVENSSTGQQNTCVGKYSATGLTTGSENAFFGNNLGNYITTLTTGTRNTLVGQYSRTSAADSTQQIVIGYNIAGKGDFTAFIGGGSGAYNGANSSSWSTTSDRRIKKNIQNNTTGLDKINQIRVRNFEYRTKEEITDFENSDAVMVDVKGVQVGVIAQEIQEVLPDVVEELGTGVLTVNPDNVTWYLVNAVKELSAKVTALEAR